MISKQKNFVALPPFLSSSSVDSFIFFAFDNHLWCWLSSEETHATCASLTGASVPIICRLERDKDSRLAKTVAKQLTKILRCNQSEVHFAGPRTHLVSIFFSIITYGSNWKNNCIHGQKASCKVVYANDFLNCSSWQTYSADFDDWV